MVFFSYHIEAVDRIKCYLWWNQQCIRFMPRDLKNILPRMFVEEYSMGSNMKYKGKSWEILKQDFGIDQMNMLDASFESLFKNMTGKAV